MQGNANGVTDMTTIAQAAHISSQRNADYWLHQVNRDLPYGDIIGMISAAKAEGLSVTQQNDKMFLVDNKAWVKVGGTVSPI